MEIPEPDGFGPKEVFAFYGLAAYRSQVLEQELILFAAMLRLSGRTNITADFVDALFDSLDRRTLGQLLREAHRLAVLPKEVAVLLGQALDARNALVHGFFEGHSEDFASNLGRASMIESLREDALLFGQADAQLTAQRRPVSEKLGITQGIVDAEFRRLIERARSRDMTAQTTEEPKE